MMPAPNRLYLVLAVFFVSLGLLSCGKKDREMIEVQAGCFEMGAPDNDPLARAFERPTRRECVKKFSLDRSEVTQKAFDEVMSSRPSANAGCLTCPVENITWADADAYCSKLKKRLPTEAEWEYAMRGGTTTHYPWGNEFSGDYAWNAHNSHKSTQPVRTCLPNPWGFYDMAGNVWEWVADWASETHTLGGKARVIRGGAFESHPYLQRSAARAWQNPDQASPAIGFRCAK